MSEQFKIEGLRELDEALKDLPKAAGKNVIRRALTRAAQPIHDQAKAMAPYKRGHLKKGMAISRVKFSSGTAGKRAFAEAMAKGASRKEAGEAAREANSAASDDVTSGIIVVGPGRHPQAIFQEFGTAHHAPQPFMRPAWEENKMKAMHTIKDILRDEIDKTVARIAKRALRGV